MSDKLIWFGNENHMQWVPAPATGMQVSHTGRAEEYEYQNGGGAVYRSDRTHKTYNIDFPVQNASGLEGVDVYKRFAAGLYGASNKYPLYFVDPMNYDQNLFPENWSAPGLFFQGWPSIGEGIAHNLYNLANNPSLEVDDTGWDGTSTSGTHGRETTGVGSGAYGDYYYQATYGASVHDGISIGGSGYHLVNPGEAYSFSIYAKPSVTKNLRLFIEWYDASGGYIDQIMGSTVSVTNTWTRLTLENKVAPPNATRVVVYVFNDGITTWATGERLFLDALLILESEWLPINYFDGDTSYDSHWLGDEGLSISSLYIPSNYPVIDLSTANTHSVPMTRALFTVNTKPDLTPTELIDYLEMPYIVIPIPEGHTLWLGATGEATGTAYIGVDLYDANGTYISASDITLTDESSSTRLSDSIPSSDGGYVKIYISRTDNSDSTISISSMTARIYETGYSPTLTGDFILGSGMTGLSFMSDALVEEYVMVNPYTNMPTRLKGMSTSLKEVSRQ